MFINQSSGLMQVFTSYTNYNKRIEQSMTKLSTGQRINRGADDAVGLMQSEKMRMQLKGIEQAQNNVQDAKSLIDVADGAMEVQTKILGRVHELALKASNETLGFDELKAIQEEVDDLLEEVEDIANTTQFNGKTLLNGDADMDITVGVNGEEINIDIRNMDIDNLGYTATTLNQFKWGGGRELTVNADNASVLAGNVDKAIRQISTERGNLGATRNRLEFRSDLLKNQNTQLTKAESRIRDVDVAKETMELTKNQMLAQASMSMMAQGMQHQQSVLMLLR